MFKTGDVVVCVDDSDCSTTYEPYKNLKKYQVYKISESRNFYNNVICILLIDIKGSFRESRFIPLKEYRKLKLEKLEKICSKKEIK